MPDVGDRLLREIFVRMEALRDHPDMGRVVPEFDQQRLRELIHPPFRIVYRRGAKQIRIVRVWRSERLVTLRIVDELGTVWRLPRQRRSPTMNMSRSGFHGRVQEPVPRANAFHPRNSAEASGSRVFASNAPRSFSSLDWSKAIALE